MKISKFLKFLPLCLIIIILPIIIFTCAKRPKYEEVDARFRELVESSYEINQMFFGSGLETYPRVSDPKSSTQVIEGSGENGKVWYYYTLDENYDVLAYRDSYLKDFTYAVKLRNTMTADELKAIFPLPEGANAADFYEQIYADKNTGVYCYTIPYEEKHYDLYYSATDPSDYDYVRLDSEYYSIESMKAAAEKVYSKDYLDAVYESMFIGTAYIEEASEYAVNLPPRYLERTDEYGDTTMMKSNTYDPLISEKRIFDYSTAKLVRKTNSKYVTIQIESYLESSPENRLTVKISMVKQEDGQWYLDSATY